MNKNQVEQRTYELFQGGFHCAESVLAAVLEASGAEEGGIPLKAATGFGGGMGRCKEETCGAITGGILALGLLQGRTSPAQCWDGIASRAAEFREKVRAITGHTKCREVLEALGPQENMEKCKRLTASSAGILHELLEKPAACAPAAACGCRR
ncbi:C-GCAxxG-C-C family protein [Fundidesulfovibrio agrisoli]|uniref:C-GCAxxG-C-C family protein n=1 Tax=Fundidesulfovibrio agrisoli TaxID=2922717 RepID=UPI001FADF2DA|nr:C-GCAxxG-C-C family protein [Fundidesulfovibrio agrisoli]